MTQVRTIFQPTALLEVSEQEAAVLEHGGLLWKGTHDKLAEHYRLAGLELPPELKPTGPAGAVKPADQAKGA